MTIATPTAVASRPVPDAAVPSNAAASGSWQGRLRYIDGLRAVAIIAVVAFHAKIPGFSGGFVGVDIFFVISGFVITRQIVARALAQRFSAAEFYAARITRIVPPLLLVTLAVIGCDRFFPLLPSELKEIDLSAAATAAMVSNYYFATGTEYFSRAAEIAPLLHTWSLGVEEQYYVFAPLIIAATVFIAQRRTWRPLRSLLAVAGATLALSWTAGAILTEHDHKVAFYFLLSRAWQFAAGGMLAVGVLDGFMPLHQVRRACGAIGAAALITAFLLLDRNTPYPGVAAVLPTLGAAFLIVCGLGKEQSALTRVLAGRPAVAIGALSYGWYLWHWPALSFVRSLDLAGPARLWDLAACAGAFALAVPTYFFIERPMKVLRQRRLAPRLVAGVIAVGLGGSAAVAVAMFAAARSPALKASLAAQEMEQPSARAPCRGDHAPPGFVRSVSCALGPAGAPQVLAWGDSHALSYANVFAALAEASGRPALVVGTLGCPPLPGVEVAISARGMCWDTSAAIAGFIGSAAAQSVTGVVIAARWAAYDGSETPSAADTRVTRISWHGPRRTPRDFAGMLEASLGEALALLGDARRKLILGPLPEFRHSAPDCLLRSKLYGLSTQSCAIDRAAVEARGRETMAALQRLAGKFPNTIVIDPHEVFCDRTKCFPSAAGGLFFSDDNHLTPLGADVVYQRFVREFRWVFGLPEP